MTNSTKYLSPTAEQTAEITRHHATFPSLTTNPPAVSRRCASLPPLHRHHTLANPARSHAPFTSTRIKGRDPAPVVTQQQGIDA